MDQSRTGWREEKVAERFAGDGWLSPFVGAVPSAIRDPLLVQQAERLQHSLPLLCLAIAANALAMMLAVIGDLPWWQQLAPPVIIMTICLVALARSRRRPATVDPVEAARRMKGALLIAAALGPIAGLWSVNAFEETERYYCMVAPVFIGIAALVSATCLLSAPRAALVAIFGTVTPIVVKMALFDNLGVRAMAVMMVVVAIMQASVVTAKFRETVRTLSLQHELERLSNTDSLTGIDNRRAFVAALQDRLTSGEPGLLLMLDLDGFKSANDTHGHQIGDAILAGVANRLRLTLPDALSIARLGGDEFALLVADSEVPVCAKALDRAIRDAMEVPFRFDDDLIAWIGASFGMARFPVDGEEVGVLMHVADRRLYADKSSRKGAGAAARRAVA